MDGIKYALRGRLGYLCDSEWDGDSFTKDPVWAWLEDKPWSGGRSVEIYECVKIMFWEETVPVHDVYIKSGMKKGKIRFRAICRRCGNMTNAMSSRENAEDRAKGFPEVCTVTKHKVIND